MFQEIQTSQKVRVRLNFMIEIRELIDQVREICEELCLYKFKNLAEKIGNIDFAMDRV